MNVNIIDAIRLSDPVGQGCLLVILLFSFHSWMVIFQKWVLLRRISRQEDLFLEDCENVGGDLEESFKRVKFYDFSPSAQLLREAMVEYQLSRSVETNPPKDKDCLRTIKDSISRVVERVMNNITDQLEGGLGSLATTANLTPMIGLFGTVWGILGAFQGLAFKGSVAIQTLAPGISTALMTTVFGLFVAIPAALFHNIFATRIRRIISDMDAFALQMQNAVERRIGSSGSGD